MAEQHTSISGKLLRLSDTPVREFVAETNMAKVLHEAAGQSDDGLAELAYDLRDISFRTEEHYVEGSTTARLHRGLLWNKLVTLALSSPNEGGQSFLEAYGYSRVNRFLAVEFGPAETATTAVLREIASEALRQTVTLYSPDHTIDFFNIYFASSLLEKMYPARDDIDIHVRLRSHLAEVTPEVGKGNPALARVLSTLFALNYPITEMSAELRAAVMKENKRIFLDKNMSTKAPKPKINIWSELQSDEQVDPADVEQSLPPLETPEPDSDEDLIEAIAEELSFDFNHAACHVKRQEGGSEKVYRALVKRMTDTMFPSNTTGVAEAQKICEHCAVREPCLEYALGNRIAVGIWGGESEKSRLRILQRRRQETEEQPVDITAS